MIELSDESKRLTSTFTTYRNDIDVYTEDNEKDREFYKVLLDRLVGHKIKINDITPLGAKSNVLKRCEEEPNNGRKKIFIVDGDINIIHEQNVPHLPNLFVLDSYCIENFLINKPTIVNYIYMACGVKSVENIEDELQFEDWLSQYTNHFIELFIHFALVDFFGGRFTLFNADRFHIANKKGLNFKPELVDQEILKLKQEILKLASLDDYNSHYQLLRLKWENSIDNFLKIVSGKDYLIPLIVFKAASFKESKTRPSLEEVKFALVHSSDLRNLQPLKDTIENL